MTSGGRTIVVPTYPPGYTDLFGAAGQVRAAARNAWIVSEIDSTAWWLYRYGTPFDGQPDAAVQFDEGDGSFEYAMLDGTPVPTLSDLIDLLRKEA